MSNPKPVVTTKGLEPIGVTLELAYPGESWQEVVLTNKTRAHIIAAVVLYELTTLDGKKALARDVIFNPNVSLESNPTRIGQLLVKHPVIPPSSRWLVGVGVDRLRIMQGLPSFEESRPLISQLPTTRPLKSVHITIDGVILEDGQIVGPQREDTKQWVSEMAGKLAEGKQ